MKTPSLLAAPFLVAMLALGTAGCAMLHPSSAPDATKPVGGKAIDLLQFRNDVQSTRIAIIRTSDALARLPDSPTAQAAFTAYSDELTSLASLIGKISQESADVRNRGKELFEQWEAEAQSIKNPDIREVAEARRVKLQGAYQEMLTPLLNARANFTPLLSDLTDLRKALALDLTPAGVQAVKPLVKKIGVQADTTIKSLDALAAELDKITAALPPPTIAPAK